MPDVALSWVITAIGVGAVLLFRWGARKFNEAAEEEDARRKALCGKCFLCRVINRQRPDLFNFAHISRQHLMAVRRVFFLNQGRFCEGMVFRFMRNLSDVDDRNWGISHLDASCWSRCFWSEEDEANNRRLLALENLDLRGLLPTEEWVAAGRAADVSCGEFGHWRCP